MFQKKIIIMRSRPRFAFTLVELLVVIAIIGILMSLALVGINAARSAAIRAQCANNMRQLGVALTAFETNRGGFPNLFTNTGHSWAVQLLPNVEQMQLHNQIERDLSGVNWNGVAVSVLRCPSDHESKTHPALSYVANAGFWLERATESDTSTAHHGLFSVLNPGGRANRVSSDDIKDGSSNTVLLSENLQANTWRPPDPAINYGTMSPADRKVFRQNSIAETGFRWRLLPGAATGEAASVDAAAEYHNLFLNANRANVTNLAANRFVRYARPSSAHPGIVHMLYADGRVAAMNDDVERDIFFRAVCPDSVEARKLWP